jgi:hypothetical protein
VETWWKDKGDLVDTVTLFLKGIEEFIDRYKDG